MDLPIEMVIFHSYVSLPEGKSHFCFGSNGTIGTMVCGQVALDEQSLAIFVIDIDAHPVVQIQVSKSNSKVDILWMEEILHQLVTIGNSKTL